MVLAKYIVGLINETRPHPVANFNICFLIMLSRNFSTKFNGTNIERCLNIVLIDVMTLRPRGHHCSFPVVVIGFTSVHSSVAVVFLSLCNFGCLSFVGFYVFTFALCNKSFTNLRDIDIVSIKSHLFDIVSKLKL